MEFLVFYGKIVKKDGGSVLQSVICFRAVIWHQHDSKLAGYQSIKKLWRKQTFVHFTGGGWYEM